MITIDNYSFICLGGNKVMRLARPNEMNDSRRRIVVVGKIAGDKPNAKVNIIEVQRYEKTYIIGSYNSYNTTYYLGTKSKEMMVFEKMVRENIPVITNFSIGYVYYSGKIGKHIPYILGQVGHEKKEKIILVESQNFEENTIIDVNGQKYFVDWLGMLSKQYQKLITEMNCFPMSLKKYFGVFCEKGLKIDLFALNNYLPILGIARTFKIK